MIGAHAYGEDLGCRILVVEDHAINWMLVERLLANRGHQAINAPNGAEALDRLADEDFDLVLMDCQMPLMDGYEATRRLRGREAGSPQHVPVVALTAHAIRGDRQRCLDAGMDDYLAKPITGPMLDEMLDRWLPFTPPPAPPLDPDRMEQLRSLFPGEETAMTIGYLQADVDQQLELLQDALRDGDGPAAAHAAHRIKGSADLVGAGLMARAAADLQVAAEGDLGQAAREALTLLRAQWEIVSAALEDERTPVL